MQEFDLILNIEESVIEEAERDAKRDAEEAGILEGKEIGFVRGYEYSKEVSFYRYLGENLLNDRNMLKVERSKQVLESLIEESNNFPKFNDENVDILECLQKVRNKMKLLRSIMKWHSHQFDYHACTKTKSSIQELKPNQGISF